MFGVITRGQLPYAKRKEERKKERKKERKRQKDGNTKERKNKRK